MEVCRKSSWLLLLLGVIFLAAALQGVQGEVESEGPSEAECRPYIEKALKELDVGDAGDDDSKEDLPTVEVTTDEPDDDDDDDDAPGDDDGKSAESNEDAADESSEKKAEAEDDDSDETGEQDDDEGLKTETNVVGEADESEENKQEDEQGSDEKDDEGDNLSKETDAADSKQDNDDSKEEDAPADVERETDADSSEEASEEATEGEASTEDDNREGDSKETVATEADDNDADGKASTEEDSNSKESTEGYADEDAAVKESTEEAEAVAEADNKEDSESKEGDNKEEVNDESKESSDEDSKADNNEETDESKENGKGDSKEEGKDESTEEVKDDSKEDGGKDDSKEDGDQGGDSSDEKEEQKSDESSEPVEEDLTQETDIPTELRPREHVVQLLKLDDESLENEKIVSRVADITLRELKKLYENAIKPLEVLYKYRDLSNRHFGDSEIFSKPMVLFMGPWSGGKSSIINYLLDNEYNETALKTGAEPSPAYFNILMYGDEPEVLDGTQLAADFTFSGLQKFGQGLEERLKGHKLSSKLLEKINIVEIPGILEVRKQVSRVFPFNDACQWFIDRADIIFLVYDPSKLDVGPETEAILDQLKGREHQTRIVLNKADQVKPEELMRVQGALIWNISPLMSSAQPPIMYTTSLWSRPYESWAPVRLLQAQERAFLRDLRSAYDKRIENKIASARRFAVRVRNHAKMVDCYLTTYYNHKSVFGNRKQVADEIIEHPQDYHIYEGLSTLTNISRYDLPDPDVYRDFFRLNPLYEFQQLSATCTYFRGCPINRLDVAIAYDLPELVGKHKKMVEAAIAEAQASAPGS